MEIIYSPAFARDYKKLPEGVKRLAEKQGLLFRKDPFDPKLKNA